MSDEFTNAEGGQDTTDAAPDAGGGSEQAQPSWLDTLPDDLKVHESLKAFEGLEGLARAHVELLAKQPTVPEEYSLTLPEGVKADEALMASFTARAKEAGLTQEQAQAVATVHAEFIKGQNDAWAKEMKGAEDSLRKEWGAEYDANLTRAQRGLAKAAGAESQALATLLDATGMGNHPVVAKMGLFIDKLTADDKLVDGQQPGGGKSAAEILFG